MQVTQSCLDHPFDSTDNGSRVLSFEPHSMNPGLLPYIGFPESKKQKTGLSDGQGSSLHHPEPWSPLDAKEAESAHPFSGEASDPGVPMVAERIHQPVSPTSLQPAQNDSVLEGVEPGSCLVLPVSKANGSSGPRGKQRSLYFQGTSSSGKLKVFLCNQDLWLQFSRQQNEMILTKQGRSMFPCLAYKIQGMDPSALYHIFVEVGPVDKHHWQYQFGRWLPKEQQQEEDHLPGNHFYQHPDSPNTGAHWMDREISFKKLKLTNQKTACKNDSQAPILLKSLHKYQPRLHIEEVSDRKQHMLVSSSSTHTFTFPDTEFIAVTTYQNSEIKHLKIQNNPFATAFREGSSCPGQSLKKFPPAGECSGSTSSPPALLVSNYPVHVQEGPGQVKVWDLMHGSQPPSGHSYDSRDSSTTTSLALPLTMEGDLLPCTSPNAVSFHPSPDTPLTQGNRLPSLSTSTSNGNSRYYLQPRSLKPQ
ncbi:T-box transcription factor TBX21-like [Monodelphis domestica]|uniref:T-box transcription factor TBX21-like n=1 Tax=Monodelphis domestica TaxID=13616 RepID=UPI0000F2C7E1|nr:T-box transcription factor TBX21-like [Monodelphis domestica]